MPALASRTAFYCRFAKRPAGEGVLRRRRLRMAVVLTTIYAEVVKTAAIRNLGPGVHVCRAEPAPSCRRALRLRVGDPSSALAKPTPSCEKPRDFALASPAFSRRQVVENSTLAFPLSYGPSVRAYSPEHVFARTPKCGRRVQANEKASACVNAPERDTFFLLEAYCAR